MFERRLQVLILLFAAPVLLIIGRLAQLQIVQGSHYQKAAMRAVTLTPRTLPFVRGNILDRTGTILVRDEPCWDVRVDYKLLAADNGDKDAIQLYIKRYSRNKRYAEADTPGTVENAFHAEIESMWDLVAQFAQATESVSAHALRERGKAIHGRIKRIRRIVKARRGFDAPVAEEYVPHAILRGLSAERQIAAREELEQLFPWVHVVSASRRHILGDAVPFAHVVGRLGSVDATHVEEDPNADDPIAKYRADERLGITGVEHVVEQRLRGRRGQITTDRDGTKIENGCFSAENGQNVSLTIHAELQQRLYRILGDTVEEIPASSGGAVVVLDIPTREILALVSYPSYDPNHFQDLYATLREDTERFPLRFRAVANQYAPGSTIKPLTCVTALNAGQLTLNTRDTCTGYMFPDIRNKWRCWPIHGTNLRQAHGDIDVVGALSGSCNVFMYRLGQSLGVNRISNAFDMFGIGEKSGTGLREEVKGINPRPSWLMSQKNLSATPGLARLFAIGQGEVSMTPIQVANLMATYASGRFRWVTLVQGESKKPEWILPGAQEHWAAIREGIYRVVNDPDGTAYNHARFEHDRYVLCGKTGSATTHGWPTSYTVSFKSKRGTELEETVRAGSRKTALEKFTSLHADAGFEITGAEIATRWPTQPPPPNSNHAHAWFGGFLQEKNAAGRPNWSRPPRVAFAVLVEFGGSGGRVTGPLARQVSEELIHALGPDLDTNAVNPGGLLP